MITLETSIAHMVWSDARFLDQILQLPDRSLALSAAPEEWSVGHLIMHLVGSAEWFNFCLTATPWSDLLPAQTMADVRKFKSQLGDLGAVLSTQVTMDDELLTINVEDEKILAHRSMILSQAIMHTAEHKGQIATILKANGLHIDLDVLDLWHFTS
ncbi:MAG: DinB family protein [Actinomycetes bacterium]